MQRFVRTGIAGASALALALLSPVATASAQEGAPVITNTETVNASLDPSGDVDVIRIYDQIAIQGSGEVSYSNPVSTAGLRNLDSFGGFTVEGDAIVEDTTVDGQQRRRAVSDFDPEQLPATVSVTYKLDGQEIDPADLVGKSGEVEATFRVENQTGQPEEITFADGKGGTVTKTVDVYDPFAGSLSFTLPSTFTDVVSDDGFVPAGDGRGGTLMNLSITMISGLTDPFVEASYTAMVENASIPPVTLSLVPVLVEANPSSAAQLEALRGGAGTGAELASNGELLDENVLLLAEGARELVNGLIQLRDGAGQLSDGLVNTAAPGSAELAAGAGELAAGLNDTALPGSQQLAAGAGDLAAGLNGTAVPGSQALASGAGDLAAGLNGTAVPGSETLAAGAQQVADGAADLEKALKKLSDGVDDLPSTVNGALSQNDDYKLLIGTLRAIIAGIGTPTDTTSATLLGGLNLAKGGLEQVKAGLRWPGGYSDTDCAVALGGGTPQKCGAMDAVQFISGALTQGATDLDQLVPAFVGLNTALGAAACPAIPPPPPSTPPATPCDLLGTIYYGLYAPNSGAQAQVLLAAGALGDVYAKVDSDLIAAGIDAQLIPGLTQIQRVLYNAPCDPAQRDPSKPDFCGISQALTLVESNIPTLVNQIVLLIQQNLQAGIGAPTPGCVPEEGKGGIRCGAAALTDGADQVAAGASQLASGLVGAADGADQVADGADQLAGGLVTAADGSSQVADGASQLSDGLATAADGSNQVADGAGQLADGLGDAADGSVQLSSGLQDAAEAAPALPQGAERLSAEGTSLLVEAGADTAQSFGERVALLEASAERTADGGLPFGGPQGAIVAAAYRYDLSGATGATAQNTGQLIAGAVIAGAAVVGATVLARRKTA